MKEFIFTGLDGTEYDLKLDFLTVREVDKTDYSAITNAAPCIMRLAESDCAALYGNFSLLAGMAFAITWHKSRLKSADFDASAEALQKAESAFLRNIDGSNVEDLRKAVWEALIDFLPLLAGDLRRIQSSELIARAEIVSREAEIQQFNKQNIRNAIQSEMTRQFKEKKIPVPLGEPSSGSSEF